MTAALTADKFARIVDALSTQFEAGQEVGIEWSFMVTDTADINAWVPRAGHVTLQLLDINDVVVRTVTVCPGEEKNYAVITTENIGPVVIDETTGTPAAFSTALDYVTAPLRAATQHDHDPVAV